MNLTPNQLKALDLKRNLLVSAGAGSGKTTILVKRYLHILLENPQLNVRNILAITFTEKAAAEMKERIFKEISRQFEINRPRQERLFNLLQQLNNVQISTIHSFCAGVLRQYAIEAQLNPSFLILSEYQIDDLLNQTFRNFFLTYRPEDAGGKKYVTRALQEYQILNLRKYFRILYRSRPVLFQFFEKMIHDSPEDILSDWQNLFVEYHQNLLQPLIDDREFWRAIHLLADLEQPGTIPSIKENFDNYNISTAKPVSRLGALINLIQIITKTDGGAYTSVPGGKKTWGDEGVSAYQEASRRAAEYSGNILPIHPETEKFAAQIFKGLSILMFNLLQAVEENKRFNNALDFDDLQIYMLQLLQQFPDIRDQLRKQYQYILVDEFQDTDFLQSSIIFLLSHDQLGELDPNRLFIVGDVKQSIFGFRNSDVSIFQDYVQMITQQGSDKIPISVPDPDNKVTISEENRRGLITLSDNFRSTANLISFFNRSFVNIFEPASEWEVDFQPLEVPEKSRDYHQSQIQLHLFLDQSENKPDMAEHEIKQVIDIINILIVDDSHQKTIIENDQIRNVPLSYGDIAILIRSRRHLFVLEHGLRNSGIPYQTYKGAGFFESREIQDIYYLLRSILNPQDDFALLTVLRSEFVGLSDVSLFYLRQVKDGTYWERLKKFEDFLDGQVQLTNLVKSEFIEHLTKNNFSLQISAEEKNAIYSILSNYSHWIELVRQGMVSRLLDAIIDDLNMKAILSVDKDSDQKLANLNKFVHYVYDFEQGTSPLLQDLIETVGKQIRGEIAEGEAVILAEDTNKVNIITYHSAKGMEFPVVILPFLGRPFQYNTEFLMDKKYGFALDLERSRIDSNTKPFIYDFIRQRDRLKIEAEEKRLFYVANTRAKDHLFLLGSLNNNRKSPSPCYLGWLMESFEINTDPDIDKDAYNISDDNFELGIFPHIIQEAGPVEQNQPVGEERGENTIDIIPKEFIKYQEPKVEEASQQEYSATQLMLFRENKKRYLKHYYLKDGQIFPPEFNIEYFEDSAGALWGSIVHKLLQDFYLREAKDDQLKMKQLFLQYELDLQQQESLSNQMKEVIKKVRKSELSKFLKKGNPKSEFLVEMPIGKFILKGIFDCMFRNPGQKWEIVDYKTNRIREDEIASTTEKYEFQMRCYALLLSYLFPGQKEYCVNLYFLEQDKLIPKIYHELEIEATRAEVAQLMNELFRMESELFYAFP
jgi:ATP-dependent helicase/nuclease subunit A